MSRIAIDNTQTFDFRILLVNGKILYPKGLYHQKKCIIAVGDTAGGTIRRKLDRTEIKEILISIKDERA